MEGMGEGFFIVEESFLIVFGAPGPERPEIRCGVRRNSLYWNTMESLLAGGICMVLRIDKSGALLVADEKTAEGKGSEGSKRI